MAASVAGLVITYQGTAAPVALAQAPKLLGLDLEEAALADRADRKQSLGPRVAEPGGLAAGHHQAADPPFAEQGLASLGGCLECGAITACIGVSLDRGRRELCGRAGAGVARALHRRGQRVEVEPGALCRERVTLSRVQAIPEREYMALPARFETRAQALDVDGSRRNRASHHKSPRAGRSRV